MKRAILLYAVVVSAACSSRATLPSAPACSEPAKDLRTRLGVSQAEAGELERERLADINHDGVDEWLLSYEGYCGSGGCEWHVYASKGGCFQWVGSLHGREVEAVPASGGWRELETASFAGSCDAHFVRARMDRGAYRPFLERDCKCVPVEGSPKPGIAVTFDPPKGCTPWRPHVGP